MNKVTEQHIRDAHAAGVKHAGTETIWSYYTTVLQLAYNAGWSGVALGPVVDCTRYGRLPSSGCSHNYRDDLSEGGVSCVSAGDDTDGSAGAKMFMADRKLVGFRGVLLVDKRGSDGEPLVLPVDEYEHLD